MRVLVRTVPVLVVLLIGGCIGEIPANSEAGMAAPSGPMSTPPVPGPVSDGGASAAPAPLLDETSPAPAQPEGSPPAVELPGQPPEEPPADGSGEQAPGTAVEQPEEPGAAGEGPDSMGEGPDSGEGQGGGESTTLRVMSLNVYGYATMPQAAGDYARMVQSHDVDVLGIQEGNQDWQISTPLPTDYSRSDALGAALGECWEQRYQIFVNTCRGVDFVSHERFDLSDGPNATRTGESAVIRKGGIELGFIDIHWDHEDGGAKAANATETAAAANAHGALPVVVLGDFNAGCAATEPRSMASQSDLTLIMDGGIDCVFSRGAPGSGWTVNASPSDHPGVIAELTTP